MAIKVTRKELQDTFVCVGCEFCNANNLLRYTPRIFYNCGAMGWNFDGYILNSTKEDYTICLTTGYRNIIHDNRIKDDYKIIEKYDEMAEKLISEQVYTREKEQELINSLISEIHAQIIEYYKNQVNRIRDNNQK